MISPQADPVPLPMSTTLAPRGKVSQGKPPRTTVELSEDAKWPMATWNLAPRFCGTSSEKGFNVVFEVRRTAKRATER